MKNILFSSLFPFDDENNTIYFKNFNVKCSLNDYFSLRFLKFCIVNSPIIDLNYHKKDGFNINNPSDFLAFSIEHWVYFLDHFYSEFNNDFELDNLSKTIFDESLSLDDLENIFFKLPFFIDLLSSFDFHDKNIFGFIDFYSKKCFSDFYHESSIYFNFFHLDKNILRFIVEQNLLDLPNILTEPSFISNFNIICSDVENNNHILSSYISQLIKENNKNDTYSLRSFYLFKIIVWVLRLNFVDSTVFLKKDYTSNPSINNPPFD